MRNYVYSAHGPTANMDHESEDWSETEDWSEADEWAEADEYSEDESVGIR